MNFAEKLYYLRNENGYSQENLAEALNVSRQTISKWELGTSVPETDKLILISDFFHVSVDYLLRGSVEKKPDGSFDRTILRFLGAAQEMDKISEELIEIMKDGIIDPEEMIRMQEIMDTLDGITRTIAEIKQKLNH